MAFYFLFAVFCALAIGTPARGECVGSLPLRLAGVVCSSLVLPAVALVSGQLAFGRIKKSPNDARQHLRRYVQMERVFPLIWSLSSLAILFVWQWRQVVQSDLGYADWILIDDVLLLLPLTVPWFLLWCVQHDIETWAMHRSSVSQTNESQTADSNDSRSRLETVSPANISTTCHWRQRVTFALQQSRVLFGVVIVPILVVSSCWDVGQRLFPGIDQHPVGWATMLIPLIGVFVLFPELLRHLWPTQTLGEGSLRRELLGVLQLTHLNVCDILVWETPNKLPNAVVTGIVPSFRYVLLTKTLVEDFSEREIRATFAHELGHIFFHHNALRMLALLSPVAAIGGARVGLEPFFHVFETDPSAILNPTISLVVLFAITVGYLIFVFGWFCRQLEHQADTFACEVLAKSLGAAEAVEQYAALLDRLASGFDRDRTEWLHPSWNARKRHVRQWHQRTTLALDN